MPAELKITGNVEDAISAITKLEKKFDTMESRHRHAMKAMRDQAKAQQDSLTDQAIGKVTNLAAGWFSVGTALSIATTNQQRFNAERQKQAQQDMVDAPRLGPVAQIANGNAAEDLKNRAAIDKAFVQGAFKDRGEAATFVTSLLQNDMGDQIPLLTKARFSTAIEDATGFGEAANTIMSAMGKEETGTYNEIYSKSIVAANVAKARGADKFLVASSEPASIASMVGVGDEELLSAMAVNSKANRSVETGATSLKNLLNQMLKNPELQGKGSLDATLSYIEGRNLKPEGLSEMLGGSVEAVQAYANLTKPDNRQLFRKTVGDLNEAAKNDLFGKTLELPLMNDPQIRAAQYAQQSANAKELALRDQGELQNLLNTVNDKRDTNLIEEYQGWGRGWQRSAHWMVGAAESWMYTPEQRVENALMSDQRARENPQFGNYGRLDDATVKNLTDVLERIATNTEIAAKARQHNRNAFND